MAKHFHTRLMALLLLCCLLPMVSFAAETSAPIGPVAVQNSEEPGPHSQAQEKTPDQPNLKASEAAAVASVAKLAVDMNNETVKRIEAFYANTVQNFVWNITVVATLVGLLGVVSVGATAAVVAKKAAKRQANKALMPIIQEHFQFAAQSTQLFADHGVIKQEHAALLNAAQIERQEFEGLRENFRVIQKDAVGNVQGLIASIIAWKQIMDYMQLIPKASDEDKSKLDGLREESRRCVNKILSEAKATDELVLSLTYSVNGIILYYDKKFEDALNSFRKSFEKDNENGSSAFNRACCACKLADELDGNGAAEKTDILALENEALLSAVEALRLQPWRKAELRNEGETGDMQRLRDHPQFIFLSS